VSLYEIGIVVDQVQLKNVNPPPPVQASFNEVNKAQQDRESLINAANGEYNREVPKARGEAESALQAAEGYALKRVNEAEGDVASFKAMLEQYAKAPEITKTRIYLETMGEVIPKAGPKIIIDESLKQWLSLLAQATKVGGQNP
jgi:membrane protease subunit HflK